VAGAVFIALAMGVFITFCLRTPHLVLQNAESGAVRFATRVDEGELFSIAFIHSVNLSPVAEIYEIRDGNIMLVALEFETFGAGIPTSLEPGQTLVHLPGDGMRIEGYERVIADLRYLIGHTADLTLHTGDREVPLRSLDEPGQSLRFAVRQLNFWQRIFV